MAEHKLQALVRGLSPWFFNKKQNNTIEGHIYPNEAGTLDLGSAVKPFRNVYAENLSGGGGGGGGETVKVSASDPTAGYLNTKIAGVSPISLSTSTSSLINISLNTNTLLLRSGANSLQGDLGVDSGVTIDGVDIGNPGNGIEISSEQYRIKLNASNPALFVDGSGLRVLGDGATISLLGNQVSVNTANNFNWIGTHTFNALTTFKDNIFIDDADLNIGSDTGLNLVIDVDGHTEFTTGQELRSTTFNDFVAGIAGFRHWDIGGNYRQLTIGAIKADELFVRKFTADEARVNRGEEFWARSFGIVETSFVVPDDEDTVDVWFEEAPGLNGFKLFLPDNWILFRTIDIDTGITVQRIWFQVVDADGAGLNDYVSRSDETDGDSTNPSRPPRQQWRLKRKFGGVTDATIGKGEVGVDFGQPFSVTDPAPGQGIVHLSALSQDSGPFVQIQTFEEVISDVPQFKNRVRMGNLNGTLDYGSDIFGFAAGDDLSVDLSSAPGDFRGFAIDTESGLRMFNTDIYLYTGATLALAIDRTYGVSLLNDDALFDNVEQTVSWYDDLDDIGGAGVTARMGAWGGSADRRFNATVYANDLSAMTLTASGNSGSANAVLWLKSGGWHGVETGIIDFYATDVRIPVTSGAFLVGAPETMLPTSVIHAYENTSDVGESAGMMVEQDGAGDAIFHWYLTGGQYFSAGIDNSDGDKWKLSASNFLATSEFIVIDPTTGTVVINGLDLSGGTPITGLTSSDSSITISGSDLVVNAALYTPTSRTISTGTGLSGGGNLTTNRTLTVDSTVARNTWAVTAGNGLTGGGNLNASGITLHVGAGTGIDVNADDVAIDLTADLTWIGTHQFNDDIQLNANLDFIGGERSITGSSNIILNAGGYLILPHGKEFRSDDFDNTTPGTITGFQFKENSASDMQLSINTIKAETLRATAFVADTTRVTGGDEFWALNYAIVHDDFTTPSAVDGTVTIYFENNPALSAQLFTSGDWIRFATIDASSSSYALVEAWGTVSGYVDRGTDAFGKKYQSWTFTLKSGDTSTVIRRGNVAVNFGVSGQGYVHLTTLDTNNGPWIGIGSWAGANPYGNLTNHVLMGNLNGSAGYTANAWGFAAGNDLSINPTTGDFIGMVLDAAAGMTIYNTDFKLYESTDVVLSITGDDGIRIAPDTTDSYFDQRAITWDGVGYILGTDNTTYSTMRMRILDSSGGIIDIGSDPGGGADSSIRINTTNGLSSAITIDSPTINLTSTYEVYMGGADGVRVYGPALYPNADITTDLGKSNKRWNTIYVENIDASSTGTVSGGSFGGPLWTYTDSITMDAVKATDTTVTVTNSGAGRADLIVDRNITLGGTVDGVDIAAHAADASAHHNPVTVGNTGLSLSTQILSLNLAATSGLIISSGLMIADTIAGDGLSISGKILAVGAGSGITVSANDIAIDLASTSGLNLTSGLAVDDSIAGAGLIISSKVLAVGAGDGIDVAADSISVDVTDIIDTAYGLSEIGGNIIIALATNSGLQLTSGLALSSALGGAGLTLSAGVLSVNVGDGLDIVTDNVEVDVTDFIDTAYGLTESSNNIRIALAVNSGLELTAGLAISDTIAGDGIAIDSGKTLSIGAGNGITVSTNSVAVNQAYSFTWTGSHTWNTGVFTFNTDPQLGANLDFIGADRLITTASSYDLTLDIGGDLILSPGGSTYVENNGEFQTITYSDAVTGITGFRMFDRGSNVRQLTTSAIKVDELYARAFVSDEVRLDRGEEYWSKSYGVVETDFVLPADEGTVNVWFEDAPGLGATPLFDAGDWILIRTINWSSSLSVIKIWMQVVDGDGAGTNDWISHDATNYRQQWTLRRKSGGSTSLVIKKGITVLDAGQVNQGWVYLSALAQDGGPFIKIGEYTSVSSDIPVFTDRVIMGLLDDLSVISGSNVWGFAAGNDLSLDESNGFSGFTVDAANGLRLYNTDVDMYDSGTKYATFSQDRGLRFLLDQYALPERRIMWLTDVDATVSNDATPVGVLLSGIYSDPNVLHTVAVISPSTTGHSSYKLSVGRTGGDYGYLQIVSNTGYGNKPAMFFGSTTLTTPQSTLHIQESNSSTSGDTGLLLDQSGSGDIMTRYKVGVAQEWITGIDNSDSDKFKISTGSTFGGSSDAIIIDISRNVLIPVDLDITGTLDVGSTITASSVSATSVTGTSVTGTNGYFPAIRATDDNGIKFYDNAGNLMFNMLDAAASIVSQGDFYVDKDTPVFTLYNPPSAIVAGNELGKIVWSMDDTSTGRNREEGANIKYTAIGTWNSSATPGKLTFGMRNGNTFIDEAFVIGSDGSSYLQGRTLIGSGTSGSSASILAIKAGGANDDAAVGGVLYKSISDVGNVGTGEDTLKSTTIYGDTLNTTNQSLYIDAFGTVAANSNNKTLKLKFGGTAFLTYGPVVLNDFTWRVIARGYRTASNTVLWISTITLSNSSGSSAASYNVINTVTATLSSDQTFLITGEATSNNDIVCKGLTIKWEDSNA